MITELQSAAVRVRAEARRQVSSRVVRGTLGGRLRGPYFWVRRSRLTVAARLDPTLLLERQRQDLADRLVDALAAAGVRHWWLPGTEGRHPALGVRIEDRETVLRVVADVATPSWYVDGLDRLGVRHFRLQAAARADRSRSLAGAPGVLIWEFVAGDRQSSFLADEAQGTSIYFWSADRAGVALVSEVANLTATRLPVTALPPSGEVPTVLRGRPIGTVDFPVDVVYTWVDGTDDAWLATKAAAAGVADQRRFTERAHDESRFADHDELRYSLRALEQYAPWVNHVWIVTADQHPNWLRRDHPWVSVVSHRDIWPDGGVGLPTFNSHAIEACLHRIPGLAEHFLYLNDDMLLARPLRAENFFHANGIGKLFASRALVDFDESVAGDIASSTAAKRARSLLEARFGVTISRKFFHTAAALTLSGLDELERTFPDVIQETRRRCFRTLDDVAMAGSLYLNWAYATGRVVPGQIRYTYIDPGAPDAERRLKTLARKRVFDAVCVNDGSTEQTLAQRQHTDALLRSFFARYLPVPGTFEV